MRARSARVASSTSYSWRSMRSRFLAASSSVRPRRASLVWRFAAAERSVWVERTERRHARPTQSNVTGAVAGVAAAQAQARSAPAAAGSTRGQPRASRPPGSRGRARSIGRQGQVRPGVRRQCAAGQKQQRQRWANAGRHGLAQAGKRHGHAQPRDQGGVDRASHQQREADQKHDGLVQQSAHGPIVRLVPRAASDVCHDLAAPRRNS